VDALANERFAAWHSGKVKEALKYDGQEMSAETRRALDTLKLGATVRASTVAATTTVSQDRSLRA